MLVQFTGRVSSAVGSRRWRCSMAELSRSRVSHEGRNFDRVTQERLRQLGMRLVRLGGECVDDPIAEVGEDLSQLGDRLLDLAEGVAGESELPSVHGRHPFL